jgi:SAM-dependent methyltransferase
MDSYYDNFNRTLLDLMRGDEQRVLEFGCGKGAFARAARQRCSLLSYYVGIDIHREAVHEAAGTMSTALCRDVDRITDWAADSELAAAAPVGTFDAVILGDVLEHLVNPERCLTQARQLVQPRGRVLACIPNVQHWSVFVQLVRGSWPRLDSGLFDRTHLRWFTLDDCVRLFDAAGLEVLSVVPRVFDRDQGLEVAQYLEPMAHLLGVEPETLSQRVLPLQYVLEGTSRA